ncbi:hypothetical protein J6590_045731 [Homalodisca vitripennis]|nr:hypothetical protein J6590_045731 [Homalodisca vitripennis]
MALRRKSDKIKPIKCSAPLIEKEHDAYCWGRDALTLPRPQDTMSWSIAVRTLDPLWAGQK